MARGGGRTSAAAAGREAVGGSRGRHQSTMVVPDEEAESSFSERDEDADKNEGTSSSERDVNADDDAEEKEIKEGATRMNFGDLNKAVEELTDPAKQKLTDMGLETFLKVKITSLHTPRKGLLFLMLKSDVQTAGESFTTKVSEERIYHITPDVVQKTFDFKNEGTFGADKLGTQKDYTSVFKDFVLELEQNGFQVSKQIKGKTRTYIGATTLTEYMKKIKKNEEMTEQAKTDKLVFLFCCMLVTKILLPTTSPYVVPRTVWMCSQENLLRNLNWPNLICLDIKKKIKDWQKKSTRMTATLAGCLAVPLINFLDSFLEAREVIPRIVEYEDKEMERLVKRAFDEVEYKEEVANAQDNVGVGNNEKGKGRRKRSQVAKRTARQTRTQQEIVIRIPTWDDLLEEAGKDNWCFRGDDETLKNELAAELHEQRKVLLDGLIRIEKTQEENFQRFKKIVRQHSKDALYKVIAEKASITDADLAKRMKDTIVVDIQGSLQISEDLFVKSLGPEGHFSNFLMECFSYILNRDWKKTRKAKVLSCCAVEELANANGRKGYLRRELSSDDLEHNKIIFIPVLHKDHWTLLVLQHKKKDPSITVLDSLNPKNLSRYHHGLINSLKSYIAELKGVEVSIKTAETSQQTNDYDCGYYMLCFLCNFNTHELKDYDQDSTLLCRKQVAYTLLTDKENRAKGNFPSNVRVYSRKRARSTRAQLANVTSEGEEETSYEEKSSDASHSDRVDGSEGRVDDSEREDESEAAAFQGSDGEEQAYEDADGEEEASQGAHGAGGKAKKVSHKRRRKTSEYQQEAAAFQGSDGEEQAYEDADGEEEASQGAHGADGEEEASQGHGAGGKAKKVSHKRRRKTSEYQHNEQPKSTFHKGSSSLKSPFEEGSGWTTKGPQQDKALLVWNAIVEEQKYWTDIFVSLEEGIIGWEAQWNLSGDDIVKSFKLHESCKDKVMSFYTLCLKKDDDKLGSDYKRYRIFIDPKISDIMLEYKKADEKQFMELICEKLGSLYTPNEVLNCRHIFMPVRHKDHWSLYVLNRSAEQFDILNSTSPVKAERVNYNKEINIKIRARLKTALKKFTGDDAFEDCKRWGFAHIDVSTQLDSQDSGFFVMKFMKEYDADGKSNNDAGVNSDNGSKRKCIFAPRESDKLRSTSLLYLLNHELNASAKTMPVGIRSLIHE